MAINSTQARFRTEKPVFPAGSPRFLTLRQETFPTTADLNIHFQTTHDRRH